MTVKDFFLNEILIFVKLIDVISVIILILCWWTIIILYKSCLLALQFENKHLLVWTIQNRTVFECLSITFDLSLDQNFARGLPTDCSQSSSIIITYSCERFNNMIVKTRSKSRPPRAKISRPYHSLDWLFTVPETTNVTGYIQFTMVGLPPSLIQKIVNIERFLNAYLSHLIWVETRTLQGVPPLS